MEQKVYTVGEAAELLKTSKDFIYDRVKEGTMRCYHFGRAIRFSMEHIDDLLKKLESGNDGQE